MSKNRHEEFYRSPAGDVLEKLGSQKDGLSNDEAQNRLEKEGYNELEEKQERSIWNILLSQINNPVIYLLVAATIVSFLFNDIPEAIAIIIVILLNTIIGFWMEYQAKTSMDALRQIDKLETQVIRDSKRIRIDSAKVVPGDILDLEAGNMIPADARIIESAELAVDESSLTGESVPVEKNSKAHDEELQVADRKNILYKGTGITSGKVKAVVIATGMNTELGKISKMTGEAGGDEIPLNEKLGRLSRRLIWFTLGLAAIFFVAGWLTGKEVYPLLQTAIAWTVAAIPEGLPIVASIALARGMLRLAKHNVIIKKLAAVETLGETTVILTDKTGTLTKNKLTVDTLVFPGGKINAGKDEKFPMEKENLQHLYKISLFCNTASIDKKEAEGDPLEIALLEFGKQVDEEKYSAIRSLEKINEDPFDSDNKFMGTIHTTDDSLYISGKGAAEPILSRCSRYRKGSSIKEINEDFRKEWIKRNDRLSSEGLRVLAFAYREEENSKKDELSGKDDFIDDMIFIGLIAFLDPAREDVGDAIKTCHQAGIKVVMVTGDHPETAANIAEKLHMTEKGQKETIHGKKLQDMDPSTEKGAGKIEKAAVFARVDPEQKLNLVKYYQEAGEIVAMTGDGVNDTPALKQADIGIAMGNRGTQAAKEVADIVLKDDAFTSIVRTIKQGRIIFENIRKFIMYQLSYHLAEIIIIAVISFSFFELALRPLQLLFLNLLSDVFPALALGIGKGSRQIMDEPPKDPEEPIITNKSWITMGIYGSVISIFVIAAYLTGKFILDYNPDVTNNIAFFSLAFAQLLHVFDMREAREKIFRNQVTQNKYVWYALAFCILVIFIAYFIPVLSNALSFMELSALQWGLILTVSVLSTASIQLLKNLFNL